MRTRLASAVAGLLLAPAPSFAQGAIDPLFAIGTGANNRVACSVMQSDGKVVIGGSFTSYNGTGINRVARLLRDGSLDGGFTPGAGAPGQVNAVALASGGGIYIAGAFTSYDGTGRNRIARLNSDGTLDTGFDPGTGFNGIVTGIVVLPDGDVVCVGDFTSFNGTGRNRIARLNSDGTLDTGFNPGTGANFLVTCVARQSDGKLLIGGFFNSYDGNTVVALARINSDGSLDTGYNLGGAGMNNAVSTITLQSDGKALVGGVFTSYNTTARNRILRLNADGSLDTGFNPGTGANGDVVAIALQSNGQVLIGGLFTAVNGSTRNRIARLNADGSLDAAWTSGANNALNTITWIPEGRAIIGGLFTSYASSARNRVLRLNAQCTDDCELSITTDANGSETAWEIIPDGYAYAAYAGSGLPSNATITENACLADGCYSLRVTDSGGDGILNGGYVLRSESSHRIIDNAGNFTTGSISAISGGQGGPTVFCIPVGGLSPIFIHRDKTDWVVGEFMQAEADPAVSQVWSDYPASSAERATTGYDFWFFNPNGGYSFRRARRHDVSDGYPAADSPARARHLKLNNWAAANHLPDFVLLNVRIRPVVLGKPGPWGPAYRFKIDPLRNSCPLTRLMDIPGNQYYSCGVTRSWGLGNFVTAVPVSRPVPGGVQSANRYQFRFRKLDNTVAAIRTVNTYHLQLNWSPGALVPGTTYKVDVRASFDGGTTWCSDFIPPSLDPWGGSCTVTIAGPALMQPDAEPPADPDHMDHASSRLPQVPWAAELAIWPNPIAPGEALGIALHGLNEDTALRLDVIDAAGRVVASSRHVASGGLWQAHVPLPALDAGTYLVRAGAGDVACTQRLVVAH